MNVDPRKLRQRRRDLASLVGDTSDPSERDEPHLEKLSFSARDVHLLKQGVSVQWLARAFRMTRHHVEKKLRACPVQSMGDWGNPMYDLVEAAAYLVEPKVDIKEYLKTAKDEDLPEKFRESVWNSKLKKQRWEEKAGHLWRTEYIMDRMGEVLANTRQSVQQIPDRVERIAGLSIEQYRIVRNATDEVLTQIYEEIVAMQEGASTFNQLHDEALPDEKPDREDLA